MQRPRVSTHKALGSAREAYVSDVAGGASEDEDHGGEGTGQAHAADLLSDRHDGLLGLIETGIHVRVADVLGSE